MKLTVLHELPGALLDLFFPRFCGYCGSSFREGLSNVLCLSCFSSIIPYEDPTCGHCGMALPEASFGDSSDPRCRDCGEEGYYLDQVRAWAPYEGPLRVAHHAFKFEGMEGLARVLVDSLWKGMPEPFWGGIEALVPVPLSPERRRERGYNPSDLLAKAISRKSSIPVMDLLRKSRPTPPQMSLTREERLRNQEGAYRLKEREDLPKRVLLLDDVYTTGATLEECAKVLKDAGVEWVGAVVLGRTEHH